MPRNYPRAEIKFSEANSSKLNRLKREIFERTGKKVSKSALVDKIVETFFEKSELSQLAFRNERTK